MGLYKALVIWRDTRKRSCRSSCESIDLLPVRCQNVSSIVIDANCFPGSLGVFPHSSTSLFLPQFTIECVPVFGQLLADRIQDDVNHIRCCQRRCSRLYSHRGSILGWVRRSPPRIPAASPICTGPATCRSHMTAESQSAKRRRPAWPAPSPR